MGTYGDRYASAIAERLRIERTRPKPHDRKTFDQLASELGLAKTTVLKYINGQREIPMSAFLELCRVLDLDPAEVLVSVRADVRGE